MLGGSGVDGAIHHAAGPEMLEECKNLNGCNTGEAKITKGCNLPAKFVIHTVGPIWNGGHNGEDQLLTNCYNNSLELAVNNQINTIAFPAISTGIYGFPLERATHIAIKTTIDFLNSDKSIKNVFFICFDKKAYQTYQNILASI